MNYTEHLILRLKTNGMCQAADKKTSKILEHNILNCIMARGRIRILATPKTEIPMTISNCFIPVDIIRKWSILDAAETLNSPLVIAMQNSSAVILLDSGQHPEKVYPGHLYALLIVVVKFPLF